MSFFRPKHCFGMHLDALSLCVSCVPKAFIPSPLRGSCVLEACIPSASRSEESSENVERALLGATVSAIITFFSAGFL